MSEWREFKLGDTGKVVTGKTPSKDNPEDWGEDILFVTPSDYKNYGKKANSSIRMLSKVGAARQGSRLLPESSVLVTCIGSDMGKTVVNARPCVTNQQINAIIPNNSIADSDYLYYLTKDLYDELRTLGGDGTAVPILNKTDFENIDVVLPLPSEQKSIAAVLSSLDDKIDLLHRQNQTLEAMAATLFRQWFVEEAGEDWEEVSVGNYVELNRSSIDKSYPYKRIQYLDTGSLSEGKIDCLLYIDLSEAPSRAKRLVLHNDIVISTVRPDQRHFGIIKNPADNMVVSTAFCVLTCTKIDPYFIFLLLTNENMTDYLHSIAEGSTSTYPSLKPSDIYAIVFQLPPKARLKEFGVIANNTWEKIEKNHIHIRTLSTLRDTLLPKLMSGEVRVALDRAAA